MEEGSSSQRLRREGEVKQMPLYLPNDKKRELIGVQHDILEIQERPC